jgi:hypothetical protein
MPIPCIPCFDHGTYILSIQPSWWHQTERRFPNWFWRGCLWTWGDYTQMVIVIRLKWWLRSLDLATRENGHCKPESFLAGKNPWSWVRPFPTKPIHCVCRLHLNFCRLQSTKNQPQTIIKKGTIWKSMVSGEKDIIRDGSKHVKAMAFFSYDWVNQHPPSSSGLTQRVPGTGYLGGHRHQAGERTHRAQLYARRCRGTLGTLEPRPGKLEDLAP